MLFPMQVELPNVSFSRDIAARAFFRNNGMPKMYDPRILIRPQYEKGSLMADVLDLVYDIEEHPVALDRMADDGCPNHEE